MHLIEITPEEIILLKIEFAYIYYSDTNYMETITFVYEDSSVHYFTGEDTNEYWASFDDFIKKSWAVFKKENPNTKLYIINEE